MSPWGFQYGFQTANTEMLAGKALERMGISSDPFSKWSLFSDVLSCLAGLDLMTVPRGPRDLCDVPKGFPDAFACLIPLIDSQGYLIYIYIYREFEMFRPKAISPHALTCNLGILFASSNTRRGVCLTHT